MQRAGGAAAVVAIVLLLLLPIVYVLALGPIVWLSEKEIIHVEPDGFLATIYSPLEELAARSDFCEQVLTRYIELWIPTQPVAIPAPPPPVMVPAPQPVPIPPAAGPQP